MYKMIEDIILKIYLDLSTKSINFNVLKISRFKMFGSKIFCIFAPTYHEMVRFLIIKVENLKKLTNYVCKD